jgi:hypothetical protein
MAIGEEELSEAEDTKHDEAEQVGLEGLVGDKPGKARDKDETPPSEETRMPFDEA